MIPVLNTIEVGRHLWCIAFTMVRGTIQFSVPQIEYPLGGSSTTYSHVYFLLIVAIILLLWCHILLLWHQVTMVASEQHLYQTIVFPIKPSTGSIHDYLFCYWPLVGILYEVVRIQFNSIQFNILFFLL